MVFDVFVLFFMQYFYSNLEQRDVSLAAGFDVIHINIYAHTFKRKNISAAIV